MAGPQDGLQGQGSFLVHVTGRMNEWERAASPSPTIVWCLASLRPLTWHIYNPAFHIGDDPKFGVKGHTGVDGTALIPHTAQYQPTREVFRVSSGRCAGGLTNTLLRRVWATPGWGGET